MGTRTPPACVRVPMPNTPRFCPSDEDLKPELTYLRRLVRRVTPDRTLQADLYDAGLERLARACLRLKSTETWRQYVRCAMHSAIVNALKKHHRRSRHEVLVGNVDVSAYPSPETILTWQEDAAAIPEADSTE